MSEIKRFNEAVQADAKMMDEVKAIGNDLKKIVEYANSKGFKFTADDLEAEAGGEVELKEEELDNVAGGLSLVVSGVVSAVVVM